MDNSRQKEQFHDWLPFYVNGRLAEPDRAWVQRYIAEHPEAMLEMQIENSLKAALANELPDVARDKGLAQFMARLRDEPDKAAKPVFLDSLRRLIAGGKSAVGPFLPDPRWAIAILVIIVQAGWLGVLLSQRATPMAEQAEWRSVGGKTQHQGPVLQITFKPSATEQEMRLLLVKIRGILLGGPGQLGHYLVKVPEDGLNAAQRQVQNSTIIESVQVLAEMPQED